MANTKITRKSVAVLLVAAAAVIAFASIAVGSETRSRPIGADASDAPDGSKCISGIAIDASIGLCNDCDPQPPAWMVCSAYCSSDDQCPTGWGCAVLSSSSGNNVRICRPWR
jgi:hypothetical protein